MSIKIDINVCRVCCKSEAANSILAYAQKFTYCTGLQVVENDGLPDKICDACLERMKIAADFKKKSESSDRQLRKFIANVNSQFHMTLVISEDVDDDETIPIEKQNDKEPKLTLTEATEPFMITVPTNSALGTTKVLSEDAEAEMCVEVEQEPEPQPEAESEPELEQEPEKFRAVAVIQEKPIIQPKNEMFEVLEIDYADQQMDQNAEEDDDMDTREQILPDEAEETDESQHVVYISIPKRYQDNSQVGDEITVDFQSRGSDSPNSVQQEDEPKYELKQDVSKTRSTANKKSDVRFECTQCAKFFSTKTNLNRHLQAHDGHKPYVCLLCAKGFTQNGSLKQHMLIHQNIRPYVCTVCEQSFSQQKSLTFHMRRHTNEKPFVCPHCSFAFRQKDGLKRHMLVKHTERDGKSFACDLCGKTLNTRYGLAMHRKRHEDGGGRSRESDTSDGIEHKIVIVAD
ncbi:zinc finger protein 69 homolog [Topomyia yanbarensis]|uniref:zinc finger protein 69 homolog n=1 Tax=Topomyia yanbarensis TaxID=2498891 RepID=UPI00273BEA3D|nr:zinc finger protein 69 homolog [Topomyia yanbarensis]